MKSDSIVINKYLPIAVIYIFLNGLFLPLGLLYTTLLTPFFIYWLYRQNAATGIGFFLLILLPFFIAHLINGINLVYYLKSFVLLFSVYIFCWTFYRFITICKTLRTIYSRILVINFCLCLFALATYTIPFFKNLLWLNANLSTGILDVSRLRLFTYEPSYYSTLLMPIALYYYFKALMKKLPSPITTIILITMPILLSLSFGVIIGLLLAVIITVLNNSAAFFTRYKLAEYIFTGGLVVIVGVIVLWLFYPQNILFVRIGNVFEGTDTSFEGRTFEAFYLGWKVADLKSLIWGSGLGQTKLLGGDLWMQVYHHSFAMNEIAIPNAVAETLAVFGIAGVLLRLGLEIHFFFRTRVYNNHYRLALFIFMFIYQFTGSFIYNIAEYAIWLLAFNNVFEEFDKPKIVLRKNYENPVDFQGNAI